MVFLILKDPSTSPVWPQPSREAPACIYWHAVPLLTAAGMPTEESKHICESVGRLRTSEQTDFTGKAADKTMMGCHIKPQDWRSVHRQKIQEHRTIISLHSVIQIAHGRRVKGENIPSKDSGKISNTSSYSKHCRMFFSFQKRLDRQQEHTLKSPLPFPPSGINRLPEPTDKPQKPRSSPKFSLQCSWALESSTAHLPPPITGQGN